jgi:hypothetical protein
MPVFPPGLTRSQVCADYGLDTEEHDKSGDKSRSSRGQRLTGQVRHDDVSHNLTDDLNDLSFSPGAASSEFHSPMGDVERATRAILGGVHDVTDRSLSSGECRQSEDNSRSMRGQLRTGPRWFEEISHKLNNDLNDLSFSPEDARTSIVQISRGLETEVWTLHAKRKTLWIDDTERQVMARENRSPSHYPQGSHNNVSQSAIQYGDDRDHHRGQASQHSNCPIYDAGPTRQSITMGPPVTLGPGLQRNNAMLAGTTAPETDALRSSPGRNQRMDLPYHKDHVPLRSRVATMEQGYAKGACSTHVQGACSTCWFQATGACGRKGRPFGKGSGGRTNAPQTYQTSSAHAGESTAQFL